jgi:hypothetical protein
MVFSPLSTLRPRDYRNTICVRICRKWEYRGVNDGGPLQHIDFVIADEQVN